MRVSYVLFIPITFHVLQLYGAFLVASTIQPINAERHANCASDHRGHD